MKEDIQWAKTQTGFRREIEQTRAEMGETVDALGYKTDVKARAKDSIQDKKESVMGAASSAKERLVGAGQSVGDATPDYSRSSSRRGAPRASPRRTRSGSPSARWRSASSSAR